MSWELPQWLQKFNLLDFSMDDSEKLDYWKNQSSKTLFMLFDFDFSFQQKFILV